MAYVNQTTQRHELADYYGITSGETTTFSLMGNGVTQLDENPNAQTKEVKYINNPSKTKTTTMYNAQFPFTAEYLRSEVAIQDVKEIATKQKTGGDCERTLVRCELWNYAYEPTEDMSIQSDKTYYTYANGVYTAVETPSVGSLSTYYERTANTYYAREIPVSVEVSSFKDTDGNLELSGNFNQAGVLVEGTFNTSTKVFTAAS